MSEPAYDPETMQALIALDNRKVDNDARRLSIDSRRFALNEAVDLLRGTNAQLRDSDAVLLCAAKFHRWLDNGELPDIGETVEHLHGYAWNLVRGLYPEADIQRAMESQDGAK